MSRTNVNSTVYRKVNKILELLCLFANLYYTLSAFNKYLI